MNFEKHTLLEKWFYKKSTFFIFCFFTFFFKLWMSVIMIMPARLWISQQVVCDRSMWLMLLYSHALLTSWVLSMWLISPVYVSWYHGFGFISIFVGLIRFMLFVELLLIRCLSNYWNSKSFSNISCCFLFMQMEVFKLACVTPTMQ